MTDGLLMVIAVATVVVAVIQVGIVVFALRTAREIGDTLRRLERDIQPVIANFRAASDDIARAASTAVAHVERAEQAISDLSRSVDHAASRLGGFARVPFNNVFAVIEGLRSAYYVLRDLRRPRQRPASVSDGVRASVSARAGDASRRPEPDEGLFIG